MVCATCAMLGSASSLAGTAIQRYSSLQCNRPVHSSQPRSATMRVRDRITACLGASQLFLPSICLRTLMDCVVPPRNPSVRSRYDGLLHIHSLSADARSSGDVITFAGHGKDAARARKSHPRGSDGQVRVCAGGRERRKGIPRVGSCFSNRKQDGPTLQVSFPPVRAAFTV